jgi:cytochrome P450
MRMLGLGTTVVVADPSDVKTVLTGDPAVFRAGEGNAFLEPIFGRHSILVQDGEPHLRQRRTVLGAFQPEVLRSNVAAVEGIVEEEIERWPVGRPFPLRPHLLTIAFRTMVRTVFGAESAERIGDLSEPVRRRFRRTAGPAGIWILLARYRRMAPGGLPAPPTDEPIYEADRILLDEVRRRRTEPAHGNDVLSLLMADGDLGDAELRDALVTMLLAGTRTTGDSLSWAFQLLLHEPEALARVREGLAAGDTSYLEAAVKETLRIHPVAPFAHRRLAAPSELAGHLLPVGTQVSPCIHLVHRRPDVYADPLAFRPDRFMNGDRFGYGWIPFGGGPRRCVGGRFAIAEMTAVIATVLDRVRVRADAPRREPPKRALFFNIPAGGTRVVVEEPARARSAAGIA